MISIHAPSRELHASRRAAILAALHRDDIVRRVWARDHTVWRPDPTEIADRLGWLDAPEAMVPEVDGLRDLGASLVEDGLHHVVLLGMGGSSLAAEVLGGAFGVLAPSEGGTRLTVLDTTDPTAVRAAIGGLDPERTCFVVSSKSGTTVETLSLFKHCYRAAVAAVGEPAAGRHFVAITDPGSHLAEQAGRLSFRALLLNDPEIGGRYSALSFFGLAPVAMAGVDVAPLLASGRQAAVACGADMAAPENPAAIVAAAVAAAAAAGRDKLVVAASPELGAFGDWLEQLIAESTGKSGKGILPVVVRPGGAGDTEGDDRLYVAVALGGDPVMAEWTARRGDAGHPVLVLEAEQKADLGALFFTWELATAILGHLLRIQPFDQPDVEAAKESAKQALEQYRSEGALPEPPSNVEGEGWAAAAPVPAGTVAETVRAFLAGMEPAPGVYVALQAFLPPGRDVAEALERVRGAAARRTGVAVTAGFGPRFLHSTGQLHKGDAGLGRFVQIVCDHSRDLAIPDDLTTDASSVTFGVLEAAQALGDYRALLEARRAVLRVDLGEDVLGGLGRLAEAIERD